MSKVIPNPGTYPAKLNGRMVPYSTDQGALCVAIPVVLLGCDVAWAGKHTMTLVKSDGTLQEKSIKNMQKAFPGWNSLEEFLDMCDTEAFDTAEFEIVGEHSEYTPPGEADARTIFKIQFLNPAGGGFAMPEKIERKEALTKWGSKFKALLGASTKTTTTKTATAEKSQPAQSAGAKTATGSQPASGTTSKAKSAGPPSRRAASNATSATARTLTQEEVWEALSKANPDENDDTLGERYYAVIDKLFPGSNADLNPSQWGEVATELGL